MPNFVFGHLLSTPSTSARPLADYKRWALLFLVFLLCGDFIFFGIYWIKSLTSLFDNPRFNLDRDRGYPELYQYLKHCWIILSLLVARRRERTPYYTAWILWFVYFLADDCWEFHERLGEYLGVTLNLPGFMGMRPQDWGELMYVAGVGSILIVPLIWALRNGSKAFRKTSIQLGALVLLLLLFGVVFDVVHEMIPHGKDIDFVLVTIEDGGEMLALSLISWYALRLMFPRFGTEPPTPTTDT